MVYKVVLKEYTEYGKLVGVDLFIDGMYAGLYKTKDDLVRRLMDGFSETLGYQGIFTEK